MEFVNEGGVNLCKKYALNFIGIHFLALDSNFTLFISNLKFFFIHGLLLIFSCHFLFLLWFQQFKFHSPFLFQIFIQLFHPRNNLVT